MSVGRLTSFVETKPKRATQLIVVLVVALVIISTTALVFALDRFFEPPYPSEETPLSLVDGGVMWTQSVNITVDEHHISYNPQVSGPYSGESNMSYLDFRFQWEIVDTPGSWGAWVGGILVNESDLDMLSAGSRAVFVSPVGGYLESVNGSLVEAIVFLRITDVLGDGVFGIGDTIEFMDSGQVGEPLPEDTVYTVALAYLGARVLSWEYSFAVHNGDFYTWSSGDLNTENPWWD